jgi:hypothetical protein
MGTRYYYADYVARASSRDVSAGLKIGLRIRRTADDSDPIANFDAVGPWCKARAGT